MTDKRLSKIKKYILAPLYGVICLVLVFIAGVQVFAPNSAIKILGFRAYIISYTGSMEPTLNYNDLIFVQKYDFDKLKKGDIITYLGYNEKGERITITHEVYEVHDDWGDKRHVRTISKVSNGQPDYIPVTLDGEGGTAKYIGKYAFKSEFLGNMISFFRSPLGLTTLVTNIVCASLIYYLLKRMQRLPYGEENILSHNIFDKRLRREMQQLEREILALEEEIRILEAAEGKQNERYHSGVDHIHAEMNTVYEEMRHPHFAIHVHRELVAIAREIHELEEELRQRLKESKGLS